MNSLRALDIETLLNTGSWHEVRSLSVLLGDDRDNSAALGHAFGPRRRDPDFAFLAAANGDTRHSFVLLRPDAVSTALLTFAIVPASRAEFAFEGFADSSLRGNRLTAALPSRRMFMNACVLLPAGESAAIAPAPDRIVVSQKGPAPQCLFLFAMQFHAREDRRSDLPVEFISSVDLAGACIGRWVVLFHNETHTAREPQFFYVDRDGPLQFVVTGLAPGAWELWHAGFVKEPSLEVPPRAGSLYFEGFAGDYFLRRYN